jgi:glycosyltransferase involved in cell wall biosynthesis
MSRPTPNKRILFIGTDAYRAGAQIALLHILTWLKANYPADLTLLLKSGGELLEDYRAVLPTHLLEPPGRSVLSALEAWARVAPFARLVRRASVSTFPVPRALASVVPDLIYANSVASLNVLDMLKPPGRCPVICHVHELQMGIRTFCGLETFAHARSRITAYIAVSQAVEDNLVSNHQVNRADIHRIYGGIGLPDASALSSATTAAPALRAELGIPPNAFVVGGCGTLDWRKSPDIFLQVAQRVSHSAAACPIHFIWVGGQRSGAQVHALMHDVERLRIGPIVHFVGPQPHPLTYFSLFDAFLLTSREDPFPLVCLEAAALATPIVCFEDAGGMPEFVGEDAGFVVPYLDVSRAADCILTLARSDGLRRSLGASAAARVRSGHDIGAVGRQISEVLNKYLF